MIVDHNPWSTRDEVTYWVGQAGLFALLGLIAVLRFAFAVVFRVIEVGTSLVCIGVVVSFAIWFITG